MVNESSLSLKYVQSMRDVLVEREAKYKDGTNLGIQYLLEQPKIRMYLIISSSSVGGPLAAVKACYDNIRYLGYEGKIEFIYNDDVEIEPNDTESDRFKKIKHFNNVKRIFPTFPEPDTTANAQVKFIRCIRGEEKFNSATAETVDTTNTYYNNHSYGCTTYGETEIEELNLGFLGNNETIGNCQKDMNLLNCKVILCGMNVGFISGIGSKYKNNNDVDILYNSDDYSNTELSTYLYHKSVIKFDNDTFMQQISSIKKENEIQKKFLTNLHYLVNTDQIHFMLVYGQGPKFQNVIKMVYNAINQLRDFKPVVLYYIKTNQSKYIDFQSEKIDGKGQWKMARYRNPDVATNRQDPNDYFLDGSDWTKFIKDCDENFNCDVCNPTNENSCDKKTIIGDEQNKILHSQLLTVFGEGFSNELFMSLAKMSTLPVILEGAGFLNDCLRNGIPFLIATHNYGCTLFLDRIEPESHVCKVAVSFDAEPDNADSINSLKKIFTEVGDPGSDTGRFYSKIFNTVNNWDHSLLYYLLNKLDIDRLKITPEQIKGYFSNFLNLDNTIKDDVFKEFCTRLTQTDGFDNIKPNNCDDADANDVKDLKDYIEDIAGYVQDNSLNASVDAAVLVDDDDDNYKNELKKFFYKDIIQQTQAQHGEKCSKEEKNTYRRVKINKKEVDLICKKSKKILGLDRKLKSSLKKENGTLSFGKYGKKLNNKTKICMKNPCWHKLSGLDKKRKKYKTWKNQMNLFTQRGGYRKKSKRKTNKNKMLKKTKRVKKLYRKVFKKPKNRKVLKSKRLKKSRKN